MADGARKVHPSNLPRRIQFVNRVGGWLRRCGLPLAELSEESIVRAACRTTGLQDWGDDRFRLPFRLLLEDYAGDGHLTFLGRVGMRHFLLRLLCNRLCIQADVKSQPDILARDIHRPLFIAGLWRSGTTLLHKLLAEDANARPLLFWETLSPTLSPAQRARGRDPRIRQAEQMVARLYRAMPRMKAMHAIDPCGPEECLGLLHNTFVCSFRGRTPRYLHWRSNIPSEEVGRAYQEYRQQLLLLQGNAAGKHWLLKAPPHLFALDTLLATFPDACIVQTHRDPLQAVPSMCSLVSAADELCYDVIDPEDIGRRTIGEMSLLIERCLAARVSLPSSRFYDLPYEDLVEDPIGSVRKIYQYFGYDYSDALEDRLKSYMAKNPRHQHGVHRYRLEDFGLDRAAVRSRFAAYCSRFGIQQD